MQRVAAGTACSLLIVLAYLTLTEKRTLSLTPNAVSLGATSPRGDIAEIEAAKNRGGRVVVWETLENQSTISTAIPTTETLKPRRLKKKVAAVPPVDYTTIYTPPPFQPSPCGCDQPPNKTDMGGRWEKMEEPDPMTSSIWRWANGDPQLDNLTIDRAVDEWMRGQDKIEEARKKPMRIMFIGDSLSRYLYVQFVNNAVKAFQVKSFRRYTDPSTRKQMLFENFPVRENFRFNESLLQLAFRRTHYFSNRSFFWEDDEVKYYNPTHVIISRGAWDLRVRLPRGNRILLHELRSGLVEARRRFGEHVRIILYGLHRLHPPLNQLPCLELQQQPIARQTIWCTARSANTALKRQGFAPIEFFDALPLSSTCPDVGLLTHGADGTHYVGAAAEGIIQNLLGSMLHPPKDDGGKGSSWTVVPPPFPETDGCAEESTLMLQPQRLVPQIDSSYCLEITMYRWSVDEYVLGNESQSVSEMFGFYDGAASNGITVSKADLALSCANFLAEVVFRLFGNLADIEFVAMSDDRVYNSTFFALEALRGVLPLAERCKAVVLSLTSEEFALTQTKAVKQLEVVCHVFQFLMQSAPVSIRRDVWKARPLSAYNCDETTTISEAIQTFWGQTRRAAVLFPVQLQLHSAMLYCLIGMMAFRSIPFSATGGQIPMTHIIYFRSKAVTSLQTNATVKSFCVDCLRYRDVLIECSSRIQSQGQAAIDQLRSYILGRRDTLQRTELMHTLALALSANANSTRAYFAAGPPKRAYAKKPKRKIVPV